MKKVGKVGEYFHPCQIQKLNMTNLRSEGVGEINIIYEGYIIAFVVDFKGDDGM